jgi:hypothetical protein
VEHIEVYRTLESMGFQYNDNLMSIVNEQNGDLNRIIEILLRNG